MNSFTKVTTLKKLSVLTAAVLLAGAARVLTAADAPAMAPTTAPTTQPMAFNKFCAVETNDAVDPKITYLYNGKVVGFCCKDCLDEFKKDPQKYMAKAK